MCCTVLSRRRRQRHRLHVRGDGGRTPSASASTSRPRRTAPVRPRDEATARRREVAMAALGGSCPSGQRTSPDRHEDDQRALRGRGGEAGLQGRDREAPLHRPRDGILRVAGRCRQQAALTRSPLPDRHVFGFAGLWERWKPADGRPGGVVHDHRRRTRTTRWRRSMTACR